MWPGAREEQRQERSDIQLAHQQGLEYSAAVRAKRRSRFYRLSRRAGLTQAVSGEARTARLFPTARIALLEVPTCYPTDGSGHDSVTQTPLDLASSVDTRLSSITSQ